MEYALAALWTLVYLYAFWFVYIGVMGIYRAYLDKRIPRPTLILASPFVLIGLVMDVAANILIATIVFVEFPREWLVTQRLTRHLKSDNGWRTDFSNVICRELLDMFDPNGKHCA